MRNLNAEFLTLVGDFECRESYDYFLLGVEYAARISAEIVLGSMRHYEGEDCTLTMRVALKSINQEIRSKFQLDDDPTHCYFCDRPKDDCACSEADRMERAERQIEQQRENS